VRVGLRIERDVFQKPLCKRSVAIFVHVLFKYLRKGIKNNRE
jgi:hypothetical protein